MDLFFITISSDFEEQTEMLTESERGHLLLAMVRYAKTGIEPQLEGNERFLWPVFRVEIDHRKELEQI